MITYIKETNSLFAETELEQKVVNALMWEASHAPSRHKFANSSVDVIFSHDDGFCWIVIYNNQTDLGVFGLMRETMGFGASPYTYYVLTFDDFLPTEVVDAYKKYKIKKKLDIFA